MRIKHNTMMRLFFGALLIIALPGVLFLALLPFCWQAGVALVALIWGFVGYGFFFGWRRLTVRTATCTSALLPEAFDGYRILQLSDLHIGTFLRNRKFIDRLVEKINEQHADVIVFTGDLVNTSADEVIPFQHALAKIKAPDGIFSVMGNHDYCEYAADKSNRNIEKNQTVLRYLEKKIGWRLLLNEHVIIGRLRQKDGVNISESIAIVGVENISRPPFQDYGDLKKALDGLSDGMFKVLLSHDPSHWRRGVLHQTDIALTLSGHTHGGQFRIGRFSPLKWMYNEYGGKYTEGDSMLYVSTGVGGTVPFRLGAWPEINVITLKRKE